MRAPSSPAPCMYVQTNDLLNASPKHTDQHRGLHQACLSGFAVLTTCKKTFCVINHPTPPIPDDLPSGKPLSRRPRRPRRPPAHVRHCVRTTTTGETPSNQSVRKDIPDPVPPREPRWPHFRQGFRGFLAASGRAGQARIPQTETEPPNQRLRSSSQPTLPGSTKTHHQISVPAEDGPLTPLLHALSFPTPLPPAPPPPPLPALRPSPLAFLLKSPAFSLLTS